jgi:3-oxoacyl-[acyl-carrier protein] reductase
MRNVIVTGGSRGLGLAIAVRLAADGFRVIAVARTETETLAEAAKNANAASLGALHFRAFDLADLEGLPRLVASISTEFGPIHGLVNNAGIGTGGVLATMPDTQIERLLRLNIASPIALTKYVAHDVFRQRNDERRRRANREHIFHRCNQWVQRPVGVFRVQGGPGGIRACPGA